MEPSQSDYFLSVKKTLGELISCESPYHDVNLALITLIEKECHEVKFTKHIKCQWKETSQGKSCCFDLLRDCDLIYGFSYPNKIRSVKMNVKIFDKIDHSLILDVPKKGTYNYTFQEPFPWCASSHSRISFEITTDDIPGIFPLILHCSALHCDKRYQLCHTPLKWETEYVSNGTLIEVKKRSKKYIKYRYSRDSSEGTSDEDAQYISIEPGVTGIYLYPEELISSEEDEGLSKQ